jgi:hypothetical protein
MRKSLTSNLRCLSPNGARAIRVELTLPSVAAATEVLGVRGFRFENGAVIT